jgi:hypothetical protein
VSLPDSLELVLLLVERAGTPPHPPHRPP